MVPVVIFVYNRLEVTKKTIKSLIKNKGSKDFPLIVLLIVFFLLGLWKVIKEGQVQMVYITTFFFILLSVFFLRFRTEVILLKADTDLLFGPSKVLSARAVPGPKDLFLVLSNGKLFTKVLSGDLKIYWVHKKRALKI